MTVVVLALLAVLVCPAPATADEAIRSIPTPRGAAQHFVLVQPSSAPPVANVILFTGGDGTIRLAGRTRMGPGGNFLVRNRDAFAGHRFLVAVPDAPSDRAADGLVGFRTGPDHAADVGALIAFLRSESPGPVWLVGTSMGTVSAANAAARLPAGQVDGIVLTATVTKASRQMRESVRDVRLGDVRVPVLVVHHEQDGCAASPPIEAEQLLPLLTGSPRKAVRFFKGGDTPRSGPCDPFAPHGFHGIDADVVALIASFIQGARP